MLAPHTACDLVISRLHYPLLGFPKLDGVRLINLTGQAVGRSLLPFKNKFTTAKFSKPEYLGLDGEATLGVITSSSLCRDTTSAVNTIEKEPNIVWMVFDFLINEVIDLPFIERYDALKYYLDNVKPESTEIIQYTVLNSTADLLAYYDTCLKLGYEGIIVRDPNGMHKNGRCNINEGAYMRLKPSSDKEAKVLSIIEAQKNSNPVKRNALGLSERSSNKINKTNSMVQCLNDK